MTFIDRRSLLAGFACAGAGSLLRPSRALAQGAAERIAVAPGSVRLLPSPAGETPVLGFGGGLAGALPRLRQGRPADLVLANEAAEPVSIHWHGLRGPNGIDGVAGLTGAAIAPGGTQAVAFTPQDAGLVLARPCLPGRSAELAEKGLTGLLVVEEAQPPPVDRDIAVFIDDIRLDEAGAHAAFGSVEERAGPGRLGNALLANGAPAPFAASVPPGGRIRLRLANGCNARAMRIRFEGAKAWVIAVDGRPAGTFEPLDSALPLAPGSRYELYVEAPEAGRSASIVAVLGAGLPLVVLKAEESAGKAQVGLPPIGPLPPSPRLPTEIRLEQATRADFVMAGGARVSDGRVTYDGDPQAIWTINGAAGEPGKGKPLASVKRDAPVVLALVNRTAFAQPVHLHGHAFRLLHALDDGWEPYWLDTTIVPPGQTQRIAFIADNPGRWLLASSVLERLDTGLSGWIEVA